MDEMEKSEAHNSKLPAELSAKVLDSIIEINGRLVIIDSNAAKLYGVETRTVNQAVKRNANRFPADYRFKLTEEEARNLKSQNVTSNWGGTRKIPYAFTEKGLYMLATILKSKTATEVTFAIIETFAKVRSLKHGLVDLHREKDKKKQTEKMHRFGELLSDLVMPDLETTETESSLELNFIIGKIKHTVKRIRRSDGTDKETDE